MQRIFGLASDFIFGKDRSTTNSIQPFVTLSQLGMPVRLGREAPENTLS